MGKVGSRMALLLLPSSHLITVAFRDRNLFDGISAVGETTEAFVKSTRIGYFPHDDLPLVPLQFGIRECAILTKSSAFTALLQPAYCRDILRVRIN